MVKHKKKLLGSLIAVVLLIVAITACLLYLKPPWKKRFFPESANFTYIGLLPSDEPSSYKICATEDCVFVAARLLKYLDMKEDPCGNFYNYACGNFLHSHSLPEGWNAFSNENIVNEAIDLKIKGILEESVQVNESDSLTKAKQVYKSCMDTSSIEKDSVDDLLEVLSNKGVGEWPFLNPRWKDCRLDLEWRMAKLNSLGISSLFHLETKFLGEDHRLFAIVKVAEPLVPNICDGDNNETMALEQASEHRDVLQSVLELLGVEVNNITEQDVNDIFEFDFFFCNVTKESRKAAGAIRDLSSSNTTLVSLSDMAPQINWFRWRNLVLSDLRLNFPHDKQHIYVDSLNLSIEAINDLLHNTSSRVLANYLTWKFVAHHLGFMGKPFRQILENHSHLLSRESSEFVMKPDRWLPRWRQCAIYVKKLMPMAILAKYSKSIDLNARKKEMEQMVPLVANEFRMILKDTRELSEIDQMRSSHKLDLIQYQLTNSNKDEKLFRKYYSNMGKMGDSFLKNGLKLSVIRMRKLMEGVSEGNTIFDMELALHIVYSAFSPETYSFFDGNQVVISLGAMQSFPLISNLPKFLTMSTFGWNMGHELAHGFDLKALDGSTHSNWTWWPSYVLKYAKSKASCYLEFFQYPQTNNFKEATHSTTLNEDICDSQGIYLAFRAYQKYLANHDGDAGLPGLPLSNQKLFFINYAQQFCEIRKSPDPRHSPGHVRVNRVLQNFPHFSETFKCSESKPMNSPKCYTLWL